MGEKEQRVERRPRHARTVGDAGQRRRGRIGRSTVRDWIEPAQTHGFDGLKPVQRVRTPALLAWRSRSRCRSLLLALQAERPGAFAFLASLIRAAQAVRAGWRRR